jgi:hypothetical protein
MPITSVSSRFIKPPVPVVRTLRHPKQLRLRFWMVNYRCDLMGNTDREACQPCESRAEVRRFTSGVVSACGAPVSGDAGSQVFRQTCPVPCGKSRRRRILLGSGRERRTIHDNHIRYGVQAVPAVQHSIAARCVHPARTRVMTRVADGLTSQVRSCSSQPGVFEETHRLVAGDQEIALGIVGGCSG